VTAYEKRAEPAVRANAGAWPSISDGASPLAPAFSFEEDGLCRTPRGSPLTFGKRQKAMPLENYPPQGPLAVNEAKIILPLLEKNGIRFKIDTDQTCRETDDGSFADSRVELFVHSEDVEAWIKIRDKFWQP
jgi:hypothetical protein